MKFLKNTTATVKNSRPNFRNTTAIVTLRSKKRQDYCLPFLLSVNTKRAKKYKEKGQRTNSNERIMGVHTNSVRYNPNRAAQQTHGWGNFTTMV